MATVYALDDWKLAFDHEEGDSESVMRLAEGIKASLDWCKDHQEACRNNLGIARAQMPQIPGPKIKAFLDDLKADGVSFKVETVEVGKLRATQREINGKVVAAIAAKGAGGREKEAILTSKEGHILDGHHRWAALLSLNPKNKMKITRVNLPIRELLKRAGDWEGSEFRDVSTFKHKVAEMYLASLRTSGEVYALDEYKLSFENDGDEDYPTKRIAEGIKASLDWCKENYEECDDNLGIARAQMPQIAGDKVPDFLSELDRDGIRYKPETVEVGKLRATQREINANKVASMVKSGIRGGGSRILTSKEGHILDGHHRWASLLTLDPKNRIKIWRINLPIRKLLKVAKSFKGVAFADLHDFRTARVAETFLRRPVPVDESKVFLQGLTKPRLAAADVTPVRQRSQFSCMAASMMMCLRAHGIECTEDEVAKVMGVKPMRGATWEDAIAAAQHYGCRASLVCPSTVDQMRGWTDEGTPIIIAWNPEGRDWSHASVVFDVKEDGTVLVADPNIPDPDETVREVPKGEFYKKWSEKWPRYLVRRPAMAVTREITEDGKQIKPSRVASVAESGGPLPPAHLDVLARYKVPFNTDAMLEMIEADPVIYQEWRQSRRKYKSRLALLHALFANFVADRGNYQAQMRYEQILEGLPT